MAAASQRAIRLLAGANVAALGTLGAAVALKPDGDATTGGVVAQAEAVGRAARLAGTLAVVAADYKGVEWFSNETKDASASERLKKAMAEQELSGLEVERAKDAAAREALGSVKSCNMSGARRAVRKPPELVLEEGLRLLWGQGWAKRPVDMGKCLAQMRRRPGRPSHVCRLPWRRFTDEM